MLAWREELGIEKKSKCFFNLFIPPSLREAESPLDSDTESDVTPSQYIHVPGPIMQPYIALIKLYDISKVALLSYHTILL